MVLFPEYIFLTHSHLYLRICIEGTELRDADPREEVSEHADELRQADVASDATGSQARGPNGADGLFDTGFAP